MNKKLIVFNWKMNPATLKKALSLANDSDYKNVVVAPPFPFIEEVGKILKRAELGAQDLSWEKRGAFTGEVSAKELKNLRVRYVIVGHSERRQKLKETDEMINKKVLAAFKAGLKVILCVGEQKRSIKYQVLSIKEAKNYIKKQLLKDLKGIKSLVVGRKLLVRNLVIAYEPVWAIGTGRADTPQDSADMIKYIKNILSSKFYILNSPVLYGGSVNSKNIKNFVKYDEIDGFLVGGASLKPTEVNKIIQICLKN